MKTGGPIGGRIRLDLVRELIERTAERMRAMTQWEEGDRFKLEAKGTIEWPRGTYVGVSFDGPELAEREHAELARAWFDQHATKIERPLEFGQRVKIPGASPDIYRVLEHSRSAPAPDGEVLVLVWPEGAGHVEQYPRHRLSPLPAEDPSAE